MARTRRQASLAADTRQPAERQAPGSKPKAPSPLKSHKKQKHAINEDDNDNVESVKRELGVVGDMFRRPESLLERVSQFVELVWLRLSIAIGSLLLTPVERAIYHSAVLLIIVLVTLGVVHQARFYAHGLLVLTHNLMQDGWAPTYERYFLGKSAS